MNHVFCDDTICALATAPGGAMAVIRISGSKAVDITDKVIRTQSGRVVSELKPYSALYGQVIDTKGDTVDDVVALLFRAPHSYTGQDVVEISCHGSNYVVTRILAELISRGCRQAGPGEFTMRAFLNGKMDLSQAEAVADLIASSNAATHRMAMSQLRGNFSQKLSQLRERLLELTSLVELELDFTDHDVEFADRDQLASLTAEIRTHIEHLLHSFTKGVAIKHGVPVAIVGKTNVGKSTLLNRLVHDEKAIVSDIHGTTRDVIEDVTQIHGQTFRFIDTAGLRKTGDTIERIGIDRAYQKMNEAAILLWLTDEPPTESETADILKRAEGKKLIAVVNKIDKHQQAYNPISGAECADSIPVVGISAKHGVNIAMLEDAIYKAADVPEVRQNDVVVTNIRHYEALSLALDDIVRVEQALDAGLSADLLSADLRSCIHHLAEIVGGEITTDETLQNIFSKFCVGK